jgi:tRNA(fMet)-specific endonuclease VapC
MKRRLLDSDAFSDIVLRRDRRVSERADTYFLAHHRHHISVVTMFEVLRGFFRIGALDRIARLERDMSDRLESFPITDTVAATAARVDAELKRRGTPVDLADLFIAATALDVGWPLVTSNTAHFRLIQDAGFALELEDWRA